ncbi:hypothetical protein BDZ89DRAFT_1100041 [Hymenopellis radicata]|nr:hypothetical protein BDZ89DRAFT_1100041 [Hymenopellis radicata]
MGTSSDAAAPAIPKIWWSNATFFVLVHVAAVAGMYYMPVYSVHRATLFFAFLTWQLADFGITVGYHRLWSHRSFRANFSVRVVLAALGSAGFQGSIKWWCLRHRLHHRFTDDLVHDPYAATRGLLYSHVGWIFFKPTYSKMDLVDREDLENDPGVPIALFLGFALPPLLGSLWGDPKGAFVWAGLIARLAIWHCTFLVNSLAHWDGLQPYSDEDTSRGNLLLALLTGGEGNHNFHHTFPHDFRSGPSRIDWDPSKWIIFVLSKSGLATGLRRARPIDMKEAVSYMKHKRSHGYAEETEELWEGPHWNLAQVEAFVQESPGRCIILIDDFVVDATGYMREHPGGASIMRKYSFRTKLKDTGVLNPTWKDATWAFEGGLNNHSRAAKRQLRELRLARYIYTEDSL